MTIGVPILCPDCGRKVTTVNGEVVQWIEIPVAQCECGFSGRIEWVNPVSSAVEQLESEDREPQRIQ
jgi:hypothetical protein